MVVSFKQPMQITMEASNQKEVAIATQEIKIVQSLVCNNPAKRAHQLRKLKQWLMLRAQSSFSFTKEDFLRIWKGLYFNMWMSDKPLVQEELAEQLAQLLYCFNNNVELSVTFFDAFLETMCLEWFGIDQWRMDKYLMLIRRMIRHIFFVLKSSEWNSDNTQLFNNVISHILMPTDGDTITGLAMQIMDCYLEELSKVSEGKISANIVAEFVKPFLRLISVHRDLKLVAHCRTRIFFHLLYQSHLGREYTEKYNAWKEMGFPTSSIDNMEKCPIEETENQLSAEMSSNLDPRANNVDVLMPELNLDGKLIIDELNAILSELEISTKRRKMLRKLLDLFTQYSKGNFPLGVKRMPNFVTKSDVPVIQEKIYELDCLEEDVLGTGRRLKQLNKRKRRQLLNSLPLSSLNENNYDQIIADALPNQRLSLHRKRARIDLMKGWVEEDITESNNTNDSKQNEKQNGITTVIHKKSKAIKRSKNIVADNGFINVSNAIQTEGKPIAVPKSTIVSQLDDVPMTEEIENFKSNTRLEITPTRKINSPQKSKISDTSTLKNPAAILKQLKNIVQFATPQKRVTIALNNNTAQNPSEYRQQIKSSPTIPYDAEKKPGKGLLKPNSIPSPINPFYKKKIGWDLRSDI